jgi:phosphatidylinositol-3-phosphatase
VRHALRYRRGASLARPRRIAAALVVVAAAVAISAAASGTIDSVGSGDRRVGELAALASRKGVVLGRVVVIVFENRAADEVFGSPAAPTFNRLARRYAVLANYYGVTHPSLPNYLALVSGSTHGITSNCTDCTVDSRSLADTLEAARKSWKTYAEGLPAPGFRGAFAGRYAKKHNPFLYFRGVLASPRRMRRIVPLSLFAGDLARGNLPDFSLIVPDLCHDMHDCSTATGDAWLGRFVRPLLSSPQLRDGVVFVVFDEGRDEDAAGGHVAALVLGPLVRPGSRSVQLLDHYALLRTIEDGWKLPRLGRSASAPVIAGIWRTR